MTRSLSKCFWIMRYSICISVTWERKHIKTQYGKFKAIKFKPLLLKGTIFEGGEKMTVWVSDDPNHVVIRVESPIVVGKVKIDMMAYRNLRYPLTSMMKLRGN